MIFCHRYKLVARSLTNEASVYATPAGSSLQEQVRTRPAAATPGLKPAQQLRLLAGKFLVAQNSLAMEFGKLFERGEDVAGRLSCNGTRLRRRGRGPCSALGRPDRQVSHIHQTVLTGEGERSAMGLLLGKAADLMIERVVNRDRASDF